MTQKGGSSAQSSFWKGGDYRQVPPPTDHVAPTKRKRNWESASYDSWGEEADDNDGIKMVGAAPPIEKPGELRRLLASRRPLLLRPPFYLRSKLISCVIPALVFNQRGHIILV